MGALAVSQPHRVIVQHDYGKTARGCRAFCNTCTWSGPWVKFASTAERHRDAHNYTPRHATPAS